MQVQVDTEIIKPLTPDRSLGFMDAEAQKEAGAYLFIHAPTWVKPNIVLTGKRPSGLADITRIFFIMAPTGFTAVYKRAKTWNRSAPT